MKLNRITLMALPAIVCASLFNACSPPREHNALNDEDKAGGWWMLFDGSTLAGWHVFNKGNVATAWKVDSGMLVCNPHTKNVKHGDLVTDREFENFELKFEWKISKAGNSGLFINVQESPEFGATFATGPEYQLLDDKNIPADYVADQTHKAASIFGVIANASKSEPKPGDWNQSRLVQKDGKATFWLNGVETLTVDFKSEDWKKKVAASGMSRYPSFGLATKGHIAVQDWTSGVAFRDMKIRLL
jgi:hypothetical protein